MSGPPESKDLGDKARGSLLVTRARVQSMLGLAVTVPMVLLGVIWPSAFTLVAVLVIPAPFIFAATVIHPEMLRKWPKLRIYLITSALSSIICLGIEAIWLVSVRR